MKRSHLFLIIIAALVISGALAIGVCSTLTERDIAMHRKAVLQIAGTHASTRPDPGSLRALPTPVRKYLEFALPDPEKSFHLAHIKAEGQFRRPLMESFAPTTASQTIAVRTPALLFDATTPIIPGLWARAYDFFADGKMEMRAKILSAITVVDEGATDALNRTSLRRWLLESPLYPMALLPGGPVRWEAIDDTHARAVISGFGFDVSLVATFLPDGSLHSFDAGEDGDLSTPYHGSGEYATRSDYRLVQGMMIPHVFEIARTGGGRTHPFWKGRITAIAFE